jgi:hypothetical protein
MAEGRSVDEFGASDRRMFLVPAAANRGQIWPSDTASDRARGCSRVRGGIDELRAPTRGSARTAFARQVAMYLAHVACGVSLTDVGILFARDRTTVAHACGVVEDKRDDPDLDCRLEHLERAVASLIDALSLRHGRQ